MQSFNHNNSSTPVKSKRLEVVAELGEKLLKTKIYNVARAAGGGNNHIYKLQSKSADYASKPIDKTLLISGIGFIQKLTLYVSCLTTVLLTFHLLLRPQNITGLQFLNGSIRNQIGLRVIATLMLVSISLENCNQSRWAWD